MFTILEELEEAVAERCYQNVLKQDKCSIATYSWKLKPIIFSYTMDARESSIKDLGVIFKTRFRFKDHITDITKITYKSYVFIYRHCKGFSNTSTSSFWYYSIISLKLNDLYLRMNVLTDFFFLIFGIPVRWSLTSLLWLLTSAIQL